MRAIWGPAQGGTGWTATPRGGPTGGLCGPLCSEPLTALVGALFKHVEFKAEEPSGSAMVEGEENALVGVDSLGPRLPGAPAHDETRI